MLDNDFADRTLPPTERRRRQAKERGEVARSPDLTAAMAVLTACGVLWFFALSSSQTLMALMRTSLTAPLQDSLTLDSAVVQIQALAGRLASVLAPIVLIPMAGAMIANLLQTGWLWTPSALAPRLGRGNQMSLNRLTPVLMRTAQWVVLGFVTWRFLVNHDSQLRSIGQGEPSMLLLLPCRLLSELLMQLLACLVLFACADYGLRFWRTELQLRMSVAQRRQEQRDERAVRPHRRQATFAGTQAALAEIERISGPR